MEHTGYTTQPDRLDVIFGALADPTRRAILSRLATGEAAVNELAAPFEISQPAVSRHLKVLEQAGLIDRQIDRQRRPARLNPEPLQTATLWLEKFKQLWFERFSNLGVLLNELKQADEMRGNND